MGIFIFIWCGIGMCVGVCGIYEYAEHGLFFDNSDTTSPREQKILNMLVVGCVLIKFTILGPLPLLNLIRPR